MTHSFSSTVTVVPEVLVRVVGDEAVLLNLRTELYLGLDPVGTRMWQLLTSTSSIQAAHDALVREYDVEPARLRQDLDEFVEKLVGQQLIELRTSAEVLRPATQ